MNSVRLGELASVKSGFAFKSKDWQETGVPVVKIGNVKEGWIALEGCSFVNDEVATSAAAFELLPGDILISMTGHIGQVAKVRNEGRMLLNQRVGRFSLRRPDQLDKEFLFQWLRLPEVRAVFEGHAYGAAQPNISPTLIEQQPIPLPPIAAQRRIASILSAYDDLIENNTRRIAILEEMARRIYEEWFVRFRFPGHENVRMVESELGLVPEGWAETSLGKIAENHDRHRKPLSKMQRESFKGPYPYYGAAKVFDYVREFLFDGQFLLLAEDGSVETPDGFPVLQLTDGKFWANNHTHILRGTEVASTEYLYLRLEKQPIRGYITGAAQPKLTQANINRIPVSLPPSELMEAFTALVKPFFELRATLGRKSANLRTTRDLLLPKLISGELDVSAMSYPEAAAA